MFEVCDASPYLSRAAKYHGEATEIVKHDTFYGRDKENIIYPIGLANLILHGIDFREAEHCFKTQDVDFFLGWMRKARPKVED